MEKLDMAPHEEQMRASLGRCKLFSSLSTAQIDEVAKHGDFLQFAQGEAIARQGKTGDAFFVIISGDTAVEMVSSETNDSFSLAQLGAGDFFTLDSPEAFRKDLTPRSRSSGSTMFRSTLAATKLFIDSRCLKQRRAALLCPPSLGTDSSVCQCYQYNRASLANHSAQFKHFTEGLWPFLAACIT